MVNRHERHDRLSALRMSKYGKIWDNSKSMSLAHLMHLLFKLEVI